MKTNVYCSNQTDRLNIFSWLVILFFIPAFLNAQQVAKTVDQKDYNELKEQGKLIGNERFIHYESSGNDFVKVTQPVNITTGGNCNCWIQRDTSWSIVPFVIGTAPEYRNDDGSTDTITLPFSFCFYNTPINKVFINNNGNVSIAAPFSTYTANPFPNTLFQMIAPFWSDVDTRNLLSGIVHYKLTSQYLIVQWDSVGYFNSYVDKVNTFQLIISNSVNEIIPNGNNVSFCYKDMQWTTGDASINPPCPSGGTGFGGCPATAGVNNGDGIHYLQIGLFDQAGAAYDGPFGNNDGIDALDNQYFYFKVCDSAANIAPIIHAAQICDSITICIGDSILLNADYLSPELGQTTNMSYTTTATTGVTLDTVINGNTAHISVLYVGSLANVGYNVVALIGTDNGMPPLTSTTSFIVQVINCPVGIAEHSVDDAIKVYPNPADENIHIAFNKGNIKNTQLILTNQLGQNVFDKMMSENGTTNEVVIPSQKLPKGIYFLTIKNDLESIVKRIEVSHQ